MKKVLIPEEKIVDFLNLLDTDDPELTIKFEYYEEFNHFYKIGIPENLATEGFMDSVFEIKGAKYAK